MFQRKSLDQNYYLDQEFLHPTPHSQQLYKLQNENKELKKKLARIKALDFIEAEARDKLGLSKKGETVVIIPEDKLKLVMGASQSAQIRLPNWLGWLKVFFK